MSCSRVFLCVFTHDSFWKPPHPGIYHFQHTTNVRLIFIAWIFLNCTNKNERKKTRVALSALDDSDNDATFSDIWYESTHNSRLACRKCWRSSIPACDCTLFSDYDDDVCGAKYTHVIVCAVSVARQTCAGM